ncbi:metal-dependent hydrolase [Granulosicoccus sp. 3-233]|uniref:metal-dependent hydrolase n=1 Tax=Granulosicoccus sp. 3-233 TaxID=3417969 RepID=UPI003D3466E5
MDSVSQIALGASLAHVTLGEKLGRWALLLGGVIGSVPDLDVLVPYEDAVENFTYHRSWSHSLFVLTVLSIPLAWLCKRAVPKVDVTIGRWWLALWLVLVTHALLDGFTVYGTQLWWPLTTPPVAWGSIFIIDPVYTLPLLVGVVAAWRYPWRHSRATVLAGLLLSSTYLGWTLVSQQLTLQKVKVTLAQSDIKANHILVAPFPFSLLWRVLVVTDDRYLEGFSSLLDEDPSVALNSFDNGKHRCRDWLDTWPVQRMDWFTRGAFALSSRDELLVLTDLRMGIEDDYVFEFVLGERRDAEWQAVPARQLPLNIDAERMRRLLKRMFDEDTDLAPPTLTPAAEVDCSVVRQVAARAVN